MFFKLGAQSISSPGPIQILTNPYAFTGFCLYGLNTMLMILALRKGQLSLLYPVISLTYVWVTLISVLLFHEPMNLLKGVGLGVIMAGVAILGRDGR